MPSTERPAYVDEHRTTIAAPSERVWTALRRYVDGALLRERHSPLLRVLATEPRAGFAIADEDPGRLLGLEGRHRFSAYRLEFEVVDHGEATELVARTYADFPGLRGQVYKTLVIRSRAHVVAVGGMLRAVRQNS